MPTFSLRIVILLLFTFFIFFQYRLWFETGGVRDMIMLKQKLSMQIELNNKLQKENEELLMQIKQSGNEMDRDESLARSELGMIKKGETFYQIVK